MKLIWFVRMKQPILAMAAKYETEFEQHRRPTRRDEFLDTMNRIVPWAVYVP